MLCPRSSPRSLTLFLLQRLSDSIPPAPITNQDPTLPALKNVLREIMVALFTLVGSAGIIPIFVYTIMAFSEVGSSLINLLFSCNPDLSVVSVNDLVRSGHQAVFVPLITSAGFPALPTNVAVEIDKLYNESERRRCTRIGHCRDSWDSN